MQSPKFVGNRDFIDSIKVLTKSVAKVPSNLPLLISRETCAAARKPPMAEEIYCGQGADILQPILT